MNDDEYDQLCAMTTFCSHPERSQWSCKAFKVTEETFAVIKRQVEHRRFRAALRTHRQELALRRYVARHQQGESICAIAQSIDLAPCMLARLILEAEYNWSKSTISTFFKDVVETSNVSETASNNNSRPSVGNLSRQEYQRITQEIQECIMTDMYCSPLADRIRHSVGVEYEYRLLETLRNRGLVFESEDLLREKGLAKTPDVRLLLPIGVFDAHDKMHIVNWIDSKAMFGDRHTHETENASQLQGYVNRYGPGMVIYWFGYMEHLSSDADVFITHRFPDKVALPGDIEPFPRLQLNGTIPSGTVLAFQSPAAIQTTYDEDDDGHPMTTVIIE